MGRPLTSRLSLSGPAFSPSASSPSTSRTSLPTLDPVPEPPQLPPLVVLPLQPPPLLPSKRSRNPSQSQRNLMTTWDSVSSIKKLSLNKNMFYVDEPQFQTKFCIMHL